jgi:hypothetical protein
VIAALAAALLAPTSVRAEAPPADAAERAHREGKQAFADRDYAAAAEHFAEAFELSDDPTFLFNRAQAERLAGDCRAAHRTYREYLERMPEASNRADVEAKIEALERCARPPPRLAPVPVLIRPARASADPLALGVRSERPAAKEPRWLGLKVALASALGMAVAIGVAGADPDIGAPVALVAVPVGLGLMTGGVIRQVSDTRRAAGDL